MNDRRFKKNNRFNGVMIFKEAVLIGTDLINRGHMI